MSITQDIHFSVPVVRLQGFKRVLRESNTAAKELGIKTIRPHRQGEALNGYQHFILRCKDRTEILYQELHGFLEDIHNGRKFKRVADGKSYW